MILLFLKITLSKNCLSITTYTKIETPAKNFNEKKIFSVSYAKIISVDNLKNGLAKITNNVPLGLDGVTKASCSEKKIEALHKSLKSHRFSPTPVRKLSISKLDDRNHPLGVVSQLDKIVQAAILIQLEPILETVFLDCSYGYRPNKNFHHALKVIKTKWQHITWIIKIDIQKYFDTTNQNLLVKMLSLYLDQATIELIKKFLGCGYIDIYNHLNPLGKTKIWASQDFLLSPILFNLYLHFLDKFIIDNLLSLWNRGDEQKYISGYHYRARLTENEQKVADCLNIKGLTEAIGRLKHNEWVKAGLPSRDVKDENFRRMFYVRYVDDLLVGFCGTHAEAVRIKSTIEEFILNNLKLKTGEAKSYVTHSSARNIQFLGFYIRYVSKNKIIKDQKKNEIYESELGYQLKSIAINSAQLRIPTELILRLAVVRGYGKARKTGSIRASSCRRLSSLEDKLIVQKFSSIIKGLVNYYSPANRLSDLWAIVAFYRKSCALTLADKHKFKTAAKVYKRYGSNLKVFDPASKKETILFYPTTLKTNTNFKLGQNNITLLSSILDLT